MSRKTPSRRTSSERGSVENNSEPRFLVIGQVGKPHGVKGEMRVVTHTDLPERFSWLEEIYVGETNPLRIEVEQVRFHKNWVLLKLTGYDDRNAAATLRGQLLQVEMADAIPLEQGEYFLFQLLGLLVIDDLGNHLGSLVEVIETGANNVFVVRGLDGDILLPDSEEVILDIDFDLKQMRVHLLPGL